MIPHVYEVIEQADVVLWERVRKACRKIPDRVEGHKLSCHHIASALGELFPVRLKVKHGFVKPAYEHSWCVTSFGNILDAYPIGMLSGGPIMIHRLAPIGHYEEANKDIINRRDLSSTAFHQQVYLVKTHMQNNLASV